MAPLLITIAQMSIFVASEVVIRERSGGTIELIVATPASFTLIIWSRVAVLTSLGLVGFLESWLLARLAFNVSITIHHGYLARSDAGINIDSISLYCADHFHPNFLHAPAAGFRNVLTFPLYLMSGVLVPTTFLPAFLQPFSHLLFLYWAAKL